MSMRERWPVRQTVPASLILAGALLANAIAASAQSAYPVRPVQVIIPFGTGGSVDLMGRHTAAALTSELKQQFVVVNREGASGTIGFTLLAQARPDGYTIGFGPTTPITIAPHLLKNIKYTLDSFEYICQVFENVFLIAVPSDSTYRTINDLMGAIKASPGKLTYGHSGVGTVGHLTVENLLHRSAMKAISVPYRANMVQDLIGARLAFGASTVGAVASTNLRVLAVFADQRHPAYPDVPTFGELNMPSMLPGLNGLYTPKGLPSEVRETLSRVCLNATRSEALRTTGQRLNVPILHLDGKAFAERARIDFRLRGEVIRFLNIKIE